MTRQKSLREQRGFWRRHGSRWKTVLRKTSNSRCEQGKRTENILYTRQFVGVLSSRRLAVKLAKRGV